MNISNAVVISAFESALPPHIKQNVQRISAVLRDRGRKDAADNESICPDEVFPKVVCRVFHLDLNTDREIVEAVASLWRSAYQEGYKEVFENV